MQEMKIRLYFLKRKKRKDKNWTQITKLQLGQVRFTA